MVASFICFCLMYVFLFLSGVYFYEQPNFQRPIHLYQMKVGENIPQYATVYAKMNVYSKPIGKVSATECYHGMAVYSGFLLIEYNENYGYIKSTNLRGESMFVEVQVAEEAPAQLIAGLTMEQLESKIQQQLRQEAEAQLQNGLFADARIAPEPEYAPYAGNAAAPIVAVAVPSPPPVADQMVTPVQAVVPMDRGAAVEV